MIAADSIDSYVSIPEFLELLCHESEFHGRRRFAVEEIAALQKEMRLFRNREIHDLRKSFAQSRAAFASAPSISTCRCS